jgi:hypothetical protein
MHTLIAVVNGKSKGFFNGCYVGRYNKTYKLPQSKLANPFTIGKDGDRTMVLVKYRQWLWQKIKEKDHAVCQELMRLSSLVKNGKEVKLTCWCNPAPCHADIIKNCLLWIITNNITLI